METQNSLFFASHFENRPLSSQWSDYAFSLKSPNAWFPFESRSDLRCEQRPQRLRWLQDRWFFGCSVFFRHAAQHEGRLYGPVILQQTHWSNPKRSQGPNCRHDSPPPPSSPSLCCTYISLSYLSLPHPLLHRECIWRSMLCFCVWEEDRFVWQKDNSQFRIHYKFRKTNTKSGKHFSFSFSPLKDFLSALNLSLIVECSSQWQVWLCWPLGLLESTRL